MRFINRHLEPREKATFRLHLTYSILDGIVLGILALNEFVFIKSLKGTDYQLGFLFQFSMVVFIFLIFFNEFLKKVRNRKKLLRIAALVTRLPLIVVAFFPRSEEAMSGDSIYHYIFLGIFLIYYFASPVIYPTINYFLKINYRHQNFGKLYSWATSANKIVMIVITFIYGIILDIDNYSYVYIFPVMALLSIVSIFTLSNIKYPKEAETEEASGKSLLKSIKESALNLFSIVKNNKSYRHFEIGFMLYGFAFMISITVITIFFERELHLNYSSVAFYKNSYYIIAIIILPFFGKLIGNIDPRKFAAMTYLSITFYIFFLIMTEIFPFHTEILGIKIYYFLLFYIIFHAIFASTMTLLWNIGSAYYCAPEEAGSYQSVHLSLTGVRAMFAPLLGVFFYEMIGFTGTFLIAIAALLTAIGLMIWSYKKDKRLRDDEIKRQ